MPASKSSKSSSYTYVKVKRNKLKNKSRNKSVRVKVKPTMLFRERVSIFFLLAIVLFFMQHFESNICTIYGTDTKWCKKLSLILIIVILIYTIIYGLNRVIMAFTFQ